MPETAMKWYFALNAASIEADDTYERCVEVAVLSALQHTNLHPHFIFDGPDCALTQRLRRWGVTVVFHRTSLSDAINATNAEPGWKRIAHGAFLRCDIPQLETESAFILYTDCDVLFRKNPDFSGVRPEFFAVAPEFTIGDYVSMNSGVMIMNVETMRRASAAFSTFIKAAIPNVSAFDQGALRDFFAGRFEPLPERFNWKPYWGANSDADIIHFHGPKPSHVRVLLNDPAPLYPAILIDLFQQAPAYYAELDRLWHAYSQRAKTLS